MKKSFSFSLIVTFSLLLLSLNVHGQGPPVQWKFYLAFEDAMGTKDTIWVGLDEAAVINSPNPALGEVASEMDSTVFNVWTHKFGSWDAHKTIIFPISGSFSLPIYGMNAILPVTLSWDTTLFNSTVLQASAAGPICNPVMDNEWFFFNSNAGWLHHAFSMLFDTEIVLPEFEWGSQDHFPIGVSFDRAHECSLLSVEGTHIDEHLMLYPNPCVNFLAFSTDLIIENIQVYDLNGKVVLRHGKTGMTGTREEIRLDVRALPPGMYLLRATAADGRVGVKKFMKSQ